MAMLLVSDYGKDPAEWQARLRDSIPAVEVRGWPSRGEPTDIDIVLADCAVAPKGGFSAFTKLRWVHYLGHGVGDMLRDPTLDAGVLVTRQRRKGMAQGLAIYVVNALTNQHLRVAEYRELQRQQRWERLSSLVTADVNVLVLGLGIIGVTIADRLAELGYAVTGWSRSLHDIAGVMTIAGPDALNDALAAADYVVAALPETDSTIGLLNRKTLALMKHGVYLINIGRGSLIAEDDLLSALDDGRVRGAQLDVFATEPLPGGHPLWSHPGVTLTPHAGGPPSNDSDETFAEVVENYRRLHNGEDLLNLANREWGY